MVELRPYQQDALDSVLAAVKTERSVLLQAATGAGKTILFSALVKACMERYQMRIGILAHREQLVRQARDKLLKVWPDGKDKIGIACKSASSSVELGRPVVIGSPQTLVRRIGETPAVHLLIVDECHRLPPADAKSQYRTLVEALRGYYPEMRLLGVTATPYRLGHGYIYGDRCRAPEQNWFQSLCYSIGTSSLQEQGYLVPLRIFAAAEPDLSGVSTSNGEFNLAQLSDRMSEGVHVHGAVQALARHAPNRRHVVAFAVSIAHAEALRDAFRAAGRKSEAVHSKMPHGERLRILDAFDRGEIEVLCNVGVLTEGWDCTSVDCMVMCRPTKSAALYVQMAGRGLRTHEGKTDCLMLDLSGNWKEHGRPEEPRVRWKNGPESEVTPGRKCPECGFVNKAGAEQCEACGYEWPPPEMIQCPRCLADVRLDAVVCPHCGFVFKEAKAVELREVPQAKPAPSGPVKARILSASADPDYECRSGNHMVMLSLVVDIVPGTLPEQVRMFLDIEGQSSSWAERRAQLAWMRLANSEPPRTLAEARKRIGELTARMPAFAVLKKDRTGKWWNVERFEEEGDGAAA